MPDFVHAPTFWDASGRLARAVVHAEVEPMLAQQLDAALRAHPDIRVDARAFVAHWGRLAGGSSSTAEELHKLQVSDLYLAFGCAQGDTAALRTLRGELLPRVAPAIRGVEASATFVEDVKEQMLDRLLVAEPGKAPRIAEYAGRGTLESWLRAVALRLSLNARRTQQRAQEVPATEALLDIAAPAKDPQLELLRARYGSAFSAAMREALTRLPRQERAVLKLHFVEGMSLNQIGGVYQTHKSTISRWLARARQSLLETTRAELEKRFPLEPGEMESILKAMGSHLELNLSTVLR